MQVFIVSHDSICPNPTAEKQKKCRAKVWRSTIHFRSVAPVWLLISSKAMCGDTLKAVVSRRIVDLQAAREPKWSQEIPSNSGTCTFVRMTAPKERELSVVWDIENSRASRRISLYRRAANPLIRQVRLCIDAHRVDGQVVPG